jgi:hypothetical protein
VRNTGAIIQLVNADTQCGFESPGVKQSVTVDGEPGKLGTATWTVEGCEIDLRAAPSVSYDCRQVATSVTGRIVVTAKRTVAGTLTGDRDLPVIPLSPDAVTIELVDVEFDNLEVKSSNTENVLIQKSGHFSAVAKPRLAASHSQGICQIPTPNIEIGSIMYDDALVHVIAEGRSFDVPVATSELTAVNGVHGDRENQISGSIQVWKNHVVMAPDHLDPDYDPETFVEGFSCTDDLALPVSHECGDIGPVLAQGAARLTIRNLGAISYITEKNTTCGFSSNAVLSNAQLSAPVGEQGEARFRVEGCKIDLAPGTVIKESCTGQKTVVSGSFTITANKTMNGRLTGNLTQPVVPMTDSPVQFEIERVELSSFRVEEDGTGMTQVGGTLAARIQPRTAMDRELGACGFETPIARFSDVAYTTPAEVAITAPQGTFRTILEASALTAVNGAWNGETNVLDGTITIGGETFTLPTNPADDGLNPEFDQVAFDRSFMCSTIDLENPFECRFGAPLAQGAAQLSAMTLGTIANVIEADTACGFSSDAVLDSVQIQGELGNPGGSAIFTIATPCRLELAAPTVLREDCNGKKTMGTGAVLVTGTKTLAGYVSGDRLQPIVPTSRDPAEISLSLTFESFAIWTEPGENRLDAHAGTLSGSVRPRTAIDTVTGACSIPTAVVLFDKMTWAEGDLTVTSAGRAFNVDVTASNLVAVNGNRDGTENALMGSITVDGEEYSIPIREGLGLDPEYDAQVFLDSFLCTPNLVLPAGDEDCNMNVPLGEGVARLLIFSLGTVAGLVNSDQFGCGFGATGTLMNPDRVQGDPGQQGEMEWRIEQCEMTFDPNDGPFASDCLDRESHMYGTALVTGNRIVEGTREELTILFFTVDSIVPNHRRAVDVRLEDVTFNEFQAYELDPGQASPARGITIHSGNMTAQVEPVTGENDGTGGGIPPPTAGAFDVPTKVARMHDVRMSAADVTILYLGKTFNVHVDRADLYAFNGSWDQAGETNTIAGEISVNGQLVQMQPKMLDPDYDQATFDARYECTSNLVSTIPPVPGGGRGP